MTDLYDTLGVSCDADPDTIKAAFRREAQRSHPDRASGNQERFHAVTKAYEVLRDPDSRARYDDTGETGTLHIDSLVTGKLAALFQQVINANDFRGDIVESCRAVVNLNISQLMRKEGEDVK